MRASNTHPILSRLIHNKLLLGGLVGAIVVALGGTAAAYMALSRTVTLSVDGHESKVRTFGDNVGDVLAAQGIKPSEHDSVVPSVDSPVNDGSRIAVRLGRPLELSIDGDKKRTLWTTGTTVASALDQLGLRIGNSALSVSRGADIDRSGMALEMTTPKLVSLKVGNAKVERRNIPAQTVGDLLQKVGAGVDRNDIVRPSRSADLTDRTQDRGHQDRRAHQARAPRVDPGARDGAEGRLDDGRRHRDRPPGQRRRARRHLQGEVPQRRGRQAHRC